MTPFMCHLYGCVSYATARNQINHITAENGVMSRVARVALVALIKGAYALVILFECG